MSESSIWDTLKEMMDRAALFVDLLEFVVFWFCVLALPVYLVVCIVRAFDRNRGDSSVGEATSDPPAGIRGWLDQKADIVISRRPRVRKHRHRHHAGLS